MRIRGPNPSRAHSRDEGSAAGSGSRVLGSPLRLPRAPLGADKAVFLLKYDYSSGSRPSAPAFGDIWVSAPREWEFGTLPAGRGGGGTGGVSREKDEKVGFKP